MLKDTIISLDIQAEALKKLSNECGGMATVSVELCINSDIFEKEVDSITNLSKYEKTLTDITQDWDNVRSFFMLTNHMAVRILEVK